jgi:hypothetical protein
MHRPDWSGVGLASLRAAHALRQSLEPYLTAIARDPGPVPLGVVSQMRTLLHHMPTTVELVRGEVAFALNHRPDTAEDLDPRLSPNYNPREDRIV